MKIDWHDAAHVTKMAATTIYEPRREKTNVLKMRKQKTQISFAVTAKLISAFVFAIWMLYLYYLNTKSKPLAISSGCTAWFVSDLVRLSHVAAHMVKALQKPSL